MNTPLGTFVRQRRADLQLTQVKLAQLAGLSQATISDIERGRNFTSREITKLADALGVKPESLLYPGQPLQQIQQSLRPYSQSWPPKALLGKIERLNDEQLEMLTGIVEDFVAREERKRKSKRKRA